MICSYKNDSVVRNEEVLNGRGREEVNRRREEGGN